MNNRLGHQANYAVAQYEEAKRNFSPKKTEVWLHIDHRLVAQWAGAKEYDSWSAAIIEGNNDGR